MVLLFFVITTSEEKSIVYGLKVLLADSLGFNFIKSCNEISDSVRPNSTLGNESVATPEPEDKAPEEHCKEECNERSEKSSNISPLKQDSGKDSKRGSKVSEASQHEESTVDCAIPHLRQEKKSCANSSESDSPGITQQLLMQAGDVESNPGPTGREGKFCMLTTT